MVLGKLNVIVENNDSHPYLSTHTKKQNKTLFETLNFEIISQIGK